MSNENLMQYLIQRIEKTPEKVYLQFQKEKITYQELYKRSMQAAAGFYEMGIRKGEKVCVMLNNSPEYLDVWFALSSIGATLVPLNVHIKGEGLRYILAHSECKTIVVEEQYLQQIGECLRSIPSNIKLIVKGEKEDRGHNEMGVPVMQLEDVLNYSGFYLPNHTIPSKELNSILYTSGTTGLPKGVMLSHAAYINAAQAFAERMVHAKAEDILFTTLPLFHINAQAHTILGAIHVNATAALSERFSASRFWDEVNFHKATIFNSLGSMIPILCKQPVRENDYNNTARITACAATPKEFWREFEERFGVQIVEGYGLTETTGFCVSNPIMANRLASIGKPFPYVDVKVVDDKGEELPQEKIGEILIQPLEDNVLMEGYYKMPEKTEEVMKGGWFHTGDRGYVDKEGYLYFCDRLKQCIRRRGENISSWEIETILNAHPKILESAAIGVPSEIGEEDVKVYVVCKPGETLLYEEIMQWCEEKMAYFMVPRYIQYIDSFPKTATERIQKFKLKEEGIGQAWDREKVGYVIKK